MRRMMMRATARMAMPVLAFATVLALPALGENLPAPVGQAASEAGVPQFRPDPLFPKPLPGNWILGQVAGIAVSPDQHIWVIHRPRTLYDD